MDHSQGLLSKLPLYGFVDKVDAMVCSHALDMDDAQYAYLLAVLSVPDKQMPAPGSTLSTSSHTLQASTPEAAAKPPEYNYLHKKEAIASVKSCLPGEDARLIEACLASMEWNAERVVDAFLQDKLPEHLRRAKDRQRDDKHLVYAPGNQPADDQKLVYAPGRVA